MKIFVARHGQTEWNKEHRICGVLESDLSEEGRRQAVELAERLKREQPENKIEAILVSPLRRARETARPIEEALGLKAVVIDDLHERDFGIYEGKDISDPGLMAVRDEPFFRLPGGESPADTARRAYNLLDRIRREYSSNVLLVCHGALMRVINTYFKSMTIEEYGSFTVSNCEVLEYETESLSN